MMFTAVLVLASASSVGAETDPILPAMPDEIMEPDPNLVRFPSQQILSQPLGSGLPLMVISVKPESIELGVTKSVVISCEAIGFQGTSMGRMRIQKKDTNRNYKVLAQIHELGDRIYLGEEDPNLASRGIIDNANQRAQLEVIYYQDLVKSFGEYFCDAIVFNRRLEPIYIKTDDLEIGRHQDVALLMLDANKKLDSLKNELQRKIEEARQSENLPAGKSKLRLLVWPRGTYSMLEPESGCPSEDITEWKKGEHGIHTESSNEQNLNEVPANSNLRKPVFSNKGGKLYSKSYFCTKATSEPGPSWPKGSFCINKMGDCPQGFQGGSVLFDEENTNHEKSSFGFLPDGTFGDDTRLNYCCRDDAPADQEIVLPNLEPFFLYRFKGVCQRVYGMNVTNEYIVIDTEDGDGNIDEYENDYHPDGTINNIRLELCYYEKSQKMLKNI